MAAPVGVQNSEVPPKLVQVKPLYGQSLALVQFWSCKVPPQ